MLFWCVIADLLTAFTGVIVDGATSFVMLGTPLVFPDQREIRHTNLELSASRHGNFRALELHLTEPSPFFQAKFNEFE